MNKIWILIGLVFIICSCGGTKNTRKHEIELADKQAKIDSLIKVSKDCSLELGMELSIQVDRQNQINILKEELTNCRN